ncbi:MAG: HAD hydrolase-like protein [Firmicutes bacterium]|nr:HAD hydrolase-like protein [Bacillota bacterium]
MIEAARRRCDQRLPLLIWDIDGTLLAVTGIGRRAMNEAFHECYGIAGAFDIVDFAGAHDHALWAEAAHRHQICDGDSAALFFHRYLRRLAALLAAFPLPVLPGVVQALSQLSAAGYELALGTGNIRPAAYLKLGRAGLAHFFPAGGFSSPGASRQEILDQALQSSQRGAPCAVVIGDTPIDVRAAHARGLAAVAVATGRFSASDLAQAGADLVLDTLEDTKPLRHLLHALP